MVMPRIALGLLAAALATPAMAALQFQQAEARDPGDGALIYTEDHLMRQDGGALAQRLVVYRCADGTAFARKQVDYRGAPLAPAFRFEDARIGYGEGLRADDDGSGRELWVRPSPDEPERSAELAPAEALVVDAGFDEFVRRRWEALVAGEAVKLRFAVPSRLDSYDFTVRRRGSTELAGEPAEVFRLKLGGLLGWLAPHIDVAYGRETRRLLRFEGLSNLRDDAGEEPLEARIDFPEPARPAEAGRWQALVSEPLSACRVRG